YPLMSRWAKDDRTRLTRLYRQTTLLLSALALPMGVLVTLGAPWIVSILFGAEFSGTVPALRILIWSTVSLYLAIASGNLLISLGRERLNLMLNVAGAALNVSLNFWLIPAWGLLGAAWATTITFVFVLVGVTIVSLVALRTSGSEPAGSAGQSANSDS